MLLYKRTDKQSPFYYARMRLNGTYSVVSTKTDALPLAKQKAEQEFYRRQFGLEEGLPAEDHTVEFVIDR